ncbi:4-hydroxybenzoate octaprenyltransferase [Wolbachia pipientis]|uniref:4-hydroxybenzoate octaprenyltransferase n=1 Tax=Wolbachia pipientis TaxID=955 RepID=A0A1E7QK44_WOLPI|nr:4-hydroxybenzoate octaprenyltransferase [Wolbachia pipientis]OEY86850.1 4-hydroxybenzoate octaprenyltransferase [Wolbachia pipientis]
MRFTSYLTLMRLNNITGLWLLLFPSLSGIILASSCLDWHTFYYLILFSVGTFLMRPAGCIINDIFDKEIDMHVERTKCRPLASGILSIKQALILFLSLLSIAFIILLLTNKITVILGIIAVFMVIIYPLLKRYIWWPQLFLGLTFNIGILMGSSAIQNKISMESLSFYIGCVFWTLSYDTIYAHQDKDDDVRIGIKSTALYFGNNTKTWLKRFYILSIMMWLYAGILASLHNIFYIALCIIGIMLYYQHKKFDCDNSAQCMLMFKNNSYIGLLLFLGIFFGRIIS